MAMINGKKIDLLITDKTVSVVFNVD